MSALKTLIGKAMGNIALGRSRHRWMDNIRMDLKEIGAYMRYWIDSDQDRDYWRTLTNAALNFGAP